MFKVIITPAQEWLLSEGRCIGCGASLKEARRARKVNGVTIISCFQCGRNFIYEKSLKRYRLSFFQGV